ncbi:MAG: nitrilase-related carbon-nitrogen hydrolase [Limisphaerales bacterium]
MWNPPQNRKLTNVEAFLWSLGAIASFHLAYSVQQFSIAILLFLVCLFQLRHLNSARKAFYVGLAIGFALYAPHLSFFWTIFKGAAIALWLVVAFWIALFLLLATNCTKRFGTKPAALLVPFLWLGLEFFRSELYYLRFSWMNIGFAFQSNFMSLFGFLGVYGFGFLLACIAVIATQLRLRTGMILLAAIALPIAYLENTPRPSTQPTQQITVAGTQMEFPDESLVIKALDRLAADYPTAKLLILSEYTFLGPVPEDVKDWCRVNERYLVVGGKQPYGSSYFNTAFVVGPTGDIVFTQGKSVPIQFFDDGLPATEQKLWDSPWGKIGICVCYDLSYRRVVDGLIRQGAQAIIVPTMDMVEWGERQHRLHARVAPMRAAEYNVPLYRVCSSGISQFVAPGGVVTASAPFPGEDESLAGALQLQAPGRLPLDHWLAPFSVGVTILTIFGLLVSVLRKRKELRKELLQTEPAASV